MKHLNKIVIPICILISFFSYSQENTEYRKMPKAKAERIVNQTLKDSTLHNVIDKVVFLKTEKKAIEFAEIVLFDIYGKENIEGQKPYEILRVGNYWVVSGTLPKGWIGGTFMILIDARNYKVVRLTHGK